MNDIIKDFNEDIGHFDRLIKSIERESDPQRRKEIESELRSLRVSRSLAEARKKHILDTMKD